MKAVLKLPFSNNFLWIEHQPNANSLVEFCSFDNTQKLNLAAENFTTLSEIELKEKIAHYEIQQEYLSEYTIPSHDEYIEKIASTINIIKKYQLPKLVISRPIAKEIPSLYIFESFLKLTQKHSNTLCYLLLSEKENWLGATPELLGKYDKVSQKFSTMSLAGTLPTGEKWSKKEIEEQKPVTDFIVQNLKKFSQKVHQSETYTHISGNIQHLRTDIEAQIEKNQLETIINELHPTPAVSGIPKDFCKEKIAEIEEYNRSFYAGYIKIETPEIIYYFVNLRCAKLYTSHAIAFAGGGITEMSIPEKEWNETELKSQAVLSVL